MILKNLVKFSETIYNKLSSMESMLDFLLL